MGSEKSCGAVVYRETDAGIEFLAIKSLANGDWGFPKGHVEKGESEEETAKREVLEETGLNVTLLDHFRTTVKYTMPNGILKQVVYFIGRAPGQAVTIQQEEIKAFRWLSYQSLLDRLTFETSKGILTQAKAFLDML